MKKRTVGILAAGAVAIIAGGVYVGMHSMGGMHMVVTNLIGEKAMHNVIGTPMLVDVDTEDFEVAELRTLFEEHSEITRTVENLPNGIRTVTFAADEELMGVVTSHVIGMIDRVDMGRDPEVIIQSPTLDILFERRASIVTEMDVTEDGIVVIQTSDDPEVVAALHTHAAEVSAMVERGMEAVHEMMAARER